MSTAAKRATRKPREVAEQHTKVADACDVLLEALTDELGWVELRRAELHATIYTIRQLRVNRE